jgi:SAM-dependent methyltransferase
LKRDHYRRWSPHCPHCGAGLGLREGATVQDDDVVSGTLVCGDVGCRHEYPIVDGIPIIMPDLQRFLGERGIELLLRDDLPPDTLSLIGDALGPDSWLDVTRQTVSCYAWDGYADLDPDEKTDLGTGDAGLYPKPGAARFCLNELLRLAGAQPGGAMLDVGCATGRTSFALAAAAPDACVLGVDLNLALLRLARRVATSGDVAYGRRRIGLAYDARRFQADLPSRDRVDFWACDASALPLRKDSARITLALNLLDCVPDPLALLRSIAGSLEPGGLLLLATPFDWAARATPVQGWIGGHSQRGVGAAAAEPLLHALLTDGAHPRSLPGLHILATGEADWKTRLHDRAFVQYRAHLIAVQRRVAAMDSI